MPAHEDRPQVSAKKRAWIISHFEPANRPKTGDYPLSFCGHSFKYVPNEYSVTLFLRGEPVIDRREADGNLSTSGQSRSPIWSSFVMRT